MRFMEPALDILQEFLPFDLIHREGDERDYEWKAPEEPEYSSQQSAMEEESIIEAVDAGEEDAEKAKQEEPVEAAQMPEEKESALSESELMKLTKKELQEKCDNLGIPYNPKDPKAALVEKILGNP